MSVVPAYPLIEGFWIRNYKAIRQIALGSSFQQFAVMDGESDFVPYELSPLTVLVGESGTGKSCILDALHFIADCLTQGLDEAIAQRGGYDAIYYRGGVGPVAFGIVFRYNAEPTPLTYILNIDKLPTGRGYIETEAILYRNAETGQPRPVLFFQNGEKSTRRVQPWYHASSSDLESVKKIDNKTLALKTLARIEDLPDIPQFAQYLSQYFIASFTSSNASSLSPTKFKLNQTENLASDLKRVKAKHPHEFDNIFNAVAKRIPGWERVEYKLTESGKPILSIYKTGMTEPVFPAQVSESDLRLLALLTLLEDPIPPRMLGLENPATNLAPAHTVAFAKSIRRYLQQFGATQFFLTTHSNVLIDQMDPTDVWRLYSDPSGNTMASRCLDELQFQGINLDSVGPFWWTDYIYRNPAGYQSGIRTAH
ncbi:ATPase [Planctomycetales bacterium]|nr:ATPase [Planctomycetales bacterium]